MLLTLYAGSTQRNACAAQIEAGAE